MRKKHLLIPVNESKYLDELKPILDKYNLEHFLDDEGPIDYVIIGFSSKPFYTTLNQEPTISNVLKIPYNLDLIEALLNMSEEVKIGQYWKYIGDTTPNKTFINGNIYRNRKLVITSFEAFVDEKNEPNGFSSLNRLKFVKATQEEIIEYFTKSKLKIEITPEIMQEKLNKILELNHGYNNAL